MGNEDLKLQFKTIAKGSLILDAAAYLISVIFIGFTLPIAAGLILGTLGMLFNLFLLGRSLENIFQSGGRKASQRYFTWYVVRIAVTVVIVAGTGLVSLTCMIGAAVPYIYPKLIYGGKTFFGKGGKD